MISTNLTGKEHSSSDDNVSVPAFFLVTAAYNSEATIAKLIKSVVSQKWMPIQWIIVDDGSVDTTAKIVDEYQKQYSFIKLERLVKDDETHSFGAKVRALNHAISKLDLPQAEFIGILDSDIELPTGYFTTLLGRMTENTSLGIAGGYIRPYYDGAFHDRLQNARWSVAGAVQMFKMQCFQEIGARFISLPYGSEDAAMEIMARAKGWEITTFEDLPVIHYGEIGVISGSRLKSRYRRGVSYASLGYHPLFLFFRCIRRMTELPWVIGSIFEFVGFVVGAIRYRPPLLDRETVAFFRKEQISRLLGRK